MYNSIRKEDSEVQKKIWQKHTSEIEVTNEMLQQPAVFQLEMANFMSLLVKSNSKSIEVGCEFGVTSYLLPKTFNKTFLDYNVDALSKCKQLGKYANDSGNYLLCDMFQIGIEYNSSFDLSFNAGVIEHYVYSDRVKLLQSMSKLINKDGIVIIAFPNHFSLPYRVAYILMNLLKKWRFPNEFKIYDLQKEANEAGMEQILRVTLSKKSIFTWLNPKPFLLIKWILKLLDKVSSFEGYLTCIILKKKDTK